MITERDIDNWFTYHAPEPDQISRFVEIREKAKDLAIAIINTSGPCPDQSTAIRKLREVVMTANAAIIFEDR